MAEPFTNYEDSTRDFKSRTGAVAQKAANGLSKLQEDIVDTTNDVKKKAGDVAQQAGDLMSSARNAAASTIDEAQKQAAAAAEQAKATATTAAGDALHKVREYADAGKNTGAGMMEDLAHAAQGAASDIEGQAPGVAKVVRSVANSVETASHDLRDSSLEQIGEAIANFARRQPLGAVAGAFVAGIILTRMMSSSNR